MYNTQTKSLKAKSKNATLSHSLPLVNFGEFSYGMTNVRALAR